MRRGSRRSQSLSLRAWSIKTPVTWPVSEKRRLFQGLKAHRPCEALRRGRGHSMLGPYQVAQAAHCQLGDWRSQAKRARRAVPLPGKSVCDMTCPTGQSTLGRNSRIALGALEGPKANEHGVPCPTGKKRLRHAMPYWAK